MDTSQQTPVQASGVAVQICEPINSTPVGMAFQASSISAGARDFGVASTVSDEKAEPGAVLRDRRAGSESESSHSSAVRMDESFQDLDAIRRFHKRALEGFEEERAGNEWRGRWWYGTYQLFAPVRLEHPLLEQQFQLWSSGLRYAAQCSGIMLVALMVLLFMIQTINDLKNYLGAVLGIWSGLLALMIIMYIAVVHGHRLPEKYRVHTLAVCSMASFTAFISMTVLGGICVDSFELHLCTEFRSGNLSSVQLFQLIAMELVLGMSFAVQVGWLITANAIYLAVNIFFVVRFQSSLGTVLLIVILSVIFTALMSFQVYHNHVNRRFEFHILHRLSKQVRTIEDKSRALASAQELALAERSVAVKATVARETHQAIMGYTCHELRNPLHGIRGCLDELLARHAPGHVVDDADVYALRNIDSACTQMHQVTDDVLDFNKLQSGHLKLRVQAVDIRELLERLVSRHAIGVDGTIVAAVDAAVPCVIEADGLRLTQIVTNGLSNAIKHMIPGSRIVVACSVWADPELLERTMLTVEVRNEGTGLHGLDTARLFQPYERGLDEDRGVKGAGLGLPISRMLVSMMNGDIGLEDQGAVTVFWFRIPLIRRSNAEGSPTNAVGLCAAPMQLLVPAGAVPDGTDPVPSNEPLHVTIAAPAPAHVDFAEQSDTVTVSPSHYFDSVTSDKPWLVWGPTRLSAAATSGRPLIALVVDDQYLNRRLLVGMLKRLGHSPIELADGDEILPALQTLPQPPDICFLDIHMVRSDGREIAQQLHAAGIKWPLVAATGNIGVSDVGSYRAAGFDGVLGKPFTVVHVQALLSAIQ